MASLGPRPSIDRTLPLYIGLLVLGVTTLTLATAYSEMRRVALSAATDRLEQVTRQMRDLLQAGVGPQVRTATNLANDPLIRPLMQGPARDTTLALDSLRRVAARTPNILAIEVWDVNGRRRYHVGQDLPELDSARVRQLIQPLSMETPTAFSPFYPHNDTIFLTLSAASFEGERVRGYVVQRRRAAGSANAAAQISALIGSNSRLLLGNRDGSGWSDFVTAKPAPPIVPDDSVRFVEYHRDGMDVLAHFATIPGTPWIIATETPRTLVFAGPNSFLLRGIASFIVLLAAGLLAGWLLSRRITRPLREVAHAADALAAGKHVEPITVRRKDEIGMLATAFNTMTVKITDHRDRLEALTKELQHVNSDLERRVAERTEQLRETNRELEAFSYSVSHDLRAPLRAIDGFSRILEEEHSSELNPGSQRLLQIVRRSTQQMGQLIDDLLAFARLGRKEVQRTWVDMTALAKTVADDAQRTMNGRSVELVVHELPPAVGDRALLRQVLLNLIENALKFTRGREPARIEVGHGEYEGHKVFFVKDNGVGFDSRYADKLFGVFQRLHRGEEFEGTGVGLALVQRIVRRHGGRAWAVGAVNEGATIYFSLSPEAPTHE